MSRSRGKGISRAQRAAVKANLIKARAAKAAKRLHLVGQEALHAERRISPQSILDREAVYILGYLDALIHATAARAGVPESALAARVGELLRREALR